MRQVSKACSSDSKLLKNQLTSSVMISVMVMVNRFLGRGMGSCSGGMVQTLRG